MCGKTNIAARLSLATGIRTFKASSEHKAFLGDQRQFINDLRYADPRILDFIKQTGTSVIFDRAYPCEWVYSKFFGRETDEAVLRYIDDGYASIGVKIIVCTRRSFVGINDDLNSNIDEKALNELSRLYKEFLCTWTHCAGTTLFVDELNNDVHREVDEIMRVMGYNRDERWVVSHL